MTIHVTTINDEYDPTLTKNLVISALISRNDDKNLIASSLFDAFVVMKMIRQ